jgi:NADPH:quinone reductase-like Zn-dependent oxidoreductase
VRAQNLALRAGPAMWQRLARYAAAGVLVPAISQRVGLDGVARAQAQMASGHGRGKIVVMP